MGAGKGSKQRQCLVLPLFFMQKQNTPIARGVLFLVL
jgi:hypothetical protein